MNKVYRAKCDHYHYTNYCCFCHKSYDDKEMIAVWVDRESGFYPRVYSEPDYCCVTCGDKKIYNPNDEDESDC